MGKLTFILCFLALCDIGHKATAVSTVEPEMWTAKNGSTDTIVFLANSTFQLHVPYNVTDGTAEGVIAFTQDKYNISASSTASSVVVTITNTAKVPSLKMIFTNDGTSYSMTDVTVLFAFDNKTFPNITNPSNKTVDAYKLNMEKVFTTKLKNSYKCSLDSQFQLDTQDKLNAWFQMSGVQLEVFTNSTSFSAAAECFADKPQTPTHSTWNFKDKALCARIQASASVKTTYMQISGKTRDTTIAIPATPSTTATCDEKKVTAVISLDDGNVQLSLAFNLVAPNARAAAQTYDLNAVSFVYNTTSQFFPNAPASSTPMSISNTTLKVHPTPVNMSYLCLVDETLTVASNLSLMLSNTQWQAFGTFPEKGFAKASECPAMQTTPIPPVTTPHPDPIVPPSYKWNAKNGNKTCFLANAGFQFRASYMKTGAKGPTQVWFDFNNQTDTISSTNCSKDTVNVTIQNWGNKNSRNQSIVLTFSKQKSKTEYALTAVKLNFEVNNVTFVNASSLNKTVLAVSDPTIVLMSTKLNQTYTCSIETQVLVTANDSSTGISNIFLRIYNVTELEAFPMNGKLSSKESQCFPDQKRPSATKGNWNVKDAKNNTCARVQSTFTVTVAYLDIMDKIMFVEIPVEGDKVGLLESKCDVNTTYLTLDIDRTKMINLTLTYKKSKPSYYTFAPADDYVLDDMTMKYMSSNWNFQNHKTYGKQITVTSGTGLNWFSTPVGKSYRCDLMQQESVGNMTSNNLTLSMKETQWEAFSINKTGDFSEARYCAAEVSTSAPETTAPVTPHPHIPSDPTVSKLLVKAADNKTVCLLADIGLQIRMNYNSTKTPALVDIGFNMNPNETQYSAVCGNNSSIVTFYNHHDQQLVNLTFTSEGNETFLSAVSVEYNITKASYPDVNQTSNGNKFSVTNLNELSAPLKHSYHCSDEADLLIDHDNNVVVRITGVKLQAFDVKNASYSPVSPCFPDTLPTKANTGNWTIMKNKTACARYMFATTFNITYPTVLGKQRSILIPLDNSTEHGGDCKDQQSYFWVKMEKITFSFLFNKTDVDGKNFNYHMFAVVVNYNLTSKYFPNHAYDNDNSVQLTNSTLDLFSSRNDRSYKCAAATSVKLNDTISTVQFKNVQVQPFGIQQDGGFSTAENCNSDLSPIIPIIVGSVLAVLVLLVLVAYFIGRKRAARIEYDTI